MRIKQHNSNAEVANSKGHDQVSKVTFPKFAEESKGNADKYRNYGSMIGIEVKNGVEGGNIYRRSPITLSRQILETPEALQPCINSHSQLLQKNN